MSSTTLPAAAQSARRAGRLARFWDSTIGKKTVMAVSGIAGIGFVFMHMAGNLQMFLPAGAPQAMHEYAVMLRKLGALLWVARIGLLVAVILHITAALQLTARNRAARPVDYATREHRTSTFAARTMRIGGILLLLFIVFHLLDMTLGVGHPRFTHLDPYNNLRIGFQRWWAAAFYVLAAGLIGMHIYHGAWASWRTLGARRPSMRPLHRTIAIALAVLVAVGMAAVPIASVLGMFPDAPPPVAHADAIVAAPPSPTGASR